MTQLKSGTPEPGAHSRRTWVMITIVIALTLLAISLVPEEEPVVVDLPPLPGAEAVTPEKSAAPAPTRKDETAAVGKQTVTEPVTPPAEAAQAEAKPGPGQAARAFIARLHQQGKDDPDAAWTEAETHWQAKRLDDAYLLYFYAARLGHAEAALALATQADPAYHGADRSALAQPDIPLALKWYGQAAAAGSKAAKLRLKKLRNRVEQSASHGDEQAQRLMLQWQ